MKVNYEMQTLGNVVEIDMDIVIPIPATLFVPETNSVHELMNSHSGIDTAIAQSHRLSPTSSTHMTTATLALLNINIVGFLGPRLEGDAGVSMVFQKSSCYDASLEGVWPEISPSSPVLDLTSPVGQLTY